jgi:O-antigen/teichoic acid export membrane protein
MVGGAAATRVSNLARGIVLAWLLAPGDFGLFGLANIVTGFAVMFGDVGVGTFLMYRSEHDEKEAQTAFWANLLLATGAAALVIAVAPVMSRFFDRRELRLVLVVSSLTLWCQVASTVPENLLRRQLRFRPIAVANVVSAVIWFGSAVALALWHWGVWALVLSMLVAQLSTLVFLFCAARWVPRWQFSWESLRQIAPFSGWYLGQAVVWFFVVNIDNIMVGRFLGTTLLGFYAIAYNYALFPVTLVGNTLGTVGYPEIAKLRHNPPEFWSSFYGVSKLLIGAIAPIALALLVMAPDLFAVVLGPKWSPAILPFQILAVYPVVCCLWVDPMSCLGDFRLLFFVGAGVLLVTSVGVYLTVHHGLPWVALAVVVGVGAGRVSTLYVTTRSMSHTLLGLRGAAPHVVTAAGAALVGWSIRHVGAQLWGPGDHRVFWICFLFVLIFGTYVVLLRHYVLEMLQRFKGMFARQPILGPVPVGE